MWDVSEALDPFLGELLARAVKHGIPKSYDRFTAAARIGASPNVALQSRL